jgi:hypothetical protein
VTVVTDRFSGSASGGTTDRYSGTVGDGSTNRFSGTASENLTNNTAPQSAAVTDGWYFTASFFKSAFFAAGHFLRGASGARDGTDRFSGSVTANLTNRY